MDKNLNELLRWSIENTDASTKDPTSQTDRSAESSNLTPEVLSALLGGPSDGDRMKEAMTDIKNPEIENENKSIAWDNFEQLVENIDNANNLTALGLWEPLVQELSARWEESRFMAAWCVGTAVQNNVKAQEKMLQQGALPTLVNLAVDDISEKVRKKAIYALSSGIRNFQPGLDEVVKHLPEDQRPPHSVDAADMEAIDAIVGRLRADSAKKEE